MARPNATPAQRAADREYSRRYRQRHKAAIAERRRARLEADPDRYHLQQRNWAAKNPDKVKAYNARYVANGAAKLNNRTYRQRHGDTLKERARAKMLREPDAVRSKRTADNNKRRARKNDAAVGTDRAAYRTFVKSVRAAVRVRCYWCGLPVPKRKRVIDHIVPLAAGGADSVENLCCACRSCNYSKNDRSPEDFSGQFHITFACASADQRPRINPPE